jgi:hypothetical protein
LNLMLHVDAKPVDYDGLHALETPPVNADARSPSRTSVWWISRGRVGMWRSDR